MAAGPPLVNARSANIPVVSLLGITAPGAETEKPYLSLVVPGDSPIQEVADLKGKTVAVNALKANSELYLRADVKAKGADPDKIEFVEVPWPDQPTALAQGRVDAIAVSEPFVTPAIDAGGSVLLSFATDVLGPDGAIAYWFTSEKQLEEKPAVMDRFERAMTKAMDYANDHPDEARETYASFANLPDGLVDSVTLPAFGPSTDASNFERDAELMVANGFLPSTPDLSGIVR